MGNESRTDPYLRSDGIANWDISAFKKTYIGEGLTLEFNAEAFNVFNRVQFLPPGTQQGLGNFGVISNAQNLPRLIQLAVKLRY